MNKFLVEYVTEIVPSHCSEIHCEENEFCNCSMCLCCSVCASGCSCPLATSDPNKKVAQLLGFGDTNYRLAILNNTLWSVGGLQNNTSVKPICIEVTYLYYALTFLETPWCCITWTLQEQLLLKLRKTTFPQMIRNLLTRILILMYGFNWLTWSCHIRYISRLFLKIL